MNDAHRSGLLYALCGFAIISTGDAIIKSTGGTWPGPAIAALRYVFSTIGLGTILALTEGRAAFAIPKPGIQFARGAAIALSAGCFFASLQFLPLAEATAITFLSPMITALLSALLLREPANRAVWTSTGIALLGVAFVLRPNLAQAGIAALLPLGSALGMAMLMVFNRMASGIGGVIRMQFMTSLMATPVLFLFTLAGHASGAPAFHMHMPSGRVVVVCAIIAVTASCAHACLYMATSRATAASIAPMTYVQLLVSLVLGAAAFGEWPDMMAMLGAALIVVAGLWLWRAGAAPKSAPVGTP